MRIESEKAYNQLLFNEKINKKIINHKYFKETFIHEYELYLDAHRGNLPKIEILEDGSIYLSDSILDKDTTNGVYVGVYSNNTCKFNTGIYNNKEYLSIERFEDFQYKIPKGYKLQNGQIIDYDLVTTSLRSSMATYNELEQTGYISFITEENSKDKILGTPSNITTLPKISIEDCNLGYIKDINKIINKNYKIDSIFRSSEYIGLLEYCTKEKLTHNNMPGEREINYRRIVDLNKQYPYSLGNVPLWNTLGYTYTDNKYPEQNKNNLKDTLIMNNIEKIRLENINNFYKENIQK